MFVIPTDLNAILFIVASHHSIETSLTGNGGTITRVSTVSGVSGRPLPSPAAFPKPGIRLTDLLSPPGSNPIQDTVKLPDRRPTEKEEEEREPILHRVKVNFW